MVSLKGLFVSHPRKAILLVAIMIAVLGASVYAYFKSLPLQSGPKVSIISPPLEFSMELNKAEYQFGENITITFSLRNIDNGTIKVTWPKWYPADSYHILITDANGVNSLSGPQLLSGLFHFDFFIIDNNGTEVYRWTEGRGALEALYEIMFEPNGYVKQILVWDHDYGLFSNQLIPRGIYQIRGKLSLIDTQYGPNGITLETPSITFIIK